MAVELTGVPETVTLSAGSATITIPGDCTAAYVFWSYYDAPDGQGLSSASINSASPDATHERPTGTGSTNENATGIVAFYTPSTGSQTLAMSFDSSIGEGPTIIVAYVKGGDTTAWNDVGSDAKTSTTGVYVTVNSNTSDLVLKFDRRYSSSGIPPGTSTGWTSKQAYAVNKGAVRLSQCDSPGATTTVCNAEYEYYSSIVAVSIIADAAVTDLLTNYYYTHLMQGGL